VRRRLLAAAVVGALAVPAAAHAAPTIYRPNPLLSAVHLDYVTPPAGPYGGIGAFAPLEQAVTAAAVADGDYLRFDLGDDLGGFLPAPIGTFALSSGGRDVVGAAGTGQIPLFGSFASSRVQSFVFTGGVTRGHTVPDDGARPVPGLGAPPTVPPPSDTDTTPPPNQGFAGRPGTTTTIRRRTTTSRKRRRRPHKRTTTSGGGSTTTTPTVPTTTVPTTTVPTTTVPTTTVPTTTVPTTTVQTSTVPTTTSGGGGGGGGSPGACGTIGLSIDSDHATCYLSLTNAAPGDSTSEVMTITNTSGQGFTLSLEVSGTQNHLWDDLTMGVWQDGTSPPSPLPPLLWWTTQYNDLTTLGPGQSIAYRIEVDLPGTAGNDDQHLAALMEFDWRAQA